MLAELGTMCTLAVLEQHTRKIEAVGVSITEENTKRRNALGKQIKCIKHKDTTFELILCPLKKRTDFKTNAEWEKHDKKQQKKGGRTIGGVAIGKTKTNRFSCLIGQAATDTYRDEATAALAFKYPAFEIIKCKYMYTTQ